MGDMREGVCSSQFWYNKESCCWDSEIVFGKDECPNWKTWSQLVGVYGSTSSYTLNYFFYVFLAFLFSLSTVVLVRFFAPYACGSGIPEVCI